MRIEGWKAALSAELVAARKRPWAWGTHDCTSFAARCAQAVTGEPYIERVADAYAYNSAQGAAAFLRDLDLRALVTGTLGPSVPWVTCRHGDLVLVSYDDSEGLFTQMLTVHDGAQLLAPKAVGIQRVPFSRALCGWKL